MPLISCPDCSNQISSTATRCPNCGCPIVRECKNKTIAVLLALLVTFGAEWFYLGKIKYGVISVIFFWTLIPTIVSIVHGIKLLIMTQEEFDFKYN